jgi:hypothetical protein
VTTYAPVESETAPATAPSRRKRKARRRTGTNACVRQLLREVDAYLEFWAAARS